MDGVTAAGGDEVSGRTNQASLPEGDGASLRLGSRFSGDVDGGTAAGGDGGSNGGSDRTQQSFFVPKDEIIANDYDLSINKYKKVEYKPVEYPPTSEILGKIKALEAEIQTGLAELETMLK